MWNIFIILIWKLINISVFSLNNFVGVQSTVAWSDCDHIFEAGVAVWGTETSCEVLGLYISWAYIVAGWVASEVDCAVSHGVQEVLSDHLFSLHVALSCVHKFLLDNSSCILDWNLCVVLCVMSLVTELLRNISKLVWCKFLVVHLARSILKAICKVSTSEFWTV